MTKDEALKLALSTLKEVRSETFRLLRNGQKLYAEEKVWNTITAIEEALNGCQCPECQVKPHASDCAVHNEPAYPKGKCNCGAQPEQEPVATDWERIARVQDAKLRAMCNEAGGFEKLCEVMDKYERTTPPQRKPLTMEQLTDLFHADGADPFEFARAIEAAHGIGEKNG